jgi:hypothetical protein
MLEALIAFPIKCSLPLHIQYVLTLLKHQMEDIENVSQVRWPFSALIPTIQLGIGDTLHFVSTMLITEAC